MGARGWIAGLVVAGLSIASGTARAAQAEGEFLALFRSACLANLTTPKSVATRFSAARVSPLPPESAQAILGGESGAAWPVQGVSGPFAVALTDKSVCMVIGTSPRLEPLVDLFEATSQQKKRDDRRTSKTARLTYAVTVPGTGGGPDGHALVEISALTSDGESVLRITAIPEAVLFGTGGSISWP
ncbi:NMCC_0638 family (lipo)protein [Segnochrobactraceae bacterium EtOH-i3]